jgi:hypothetical protein
MSLTNRTTKRMLPDNLPLRHVLLHIYKVYFIHFVMEIYFFTHYRLCPFIST